MIYKKRKFVSFDQLTHFTVNEINVLYVSLLYFTDNVEKSEEKSPYNF